jgi:mono/diheme cytochrome c family protein
MAVEMFDAPLRDDERAQLLAFVDAPVPSGFADRVVTAWTEERTDPAPEPSRVVPLLRRRHRRRLRVTVAAIVSIAATLLVAWWSRAAMVERSEARERTARLAARQLDPPPALARMRVDAHALLAANCAPCHDSTASGADGDALEVFDLQHPAWWLSMSDRQLRVVIDRMATRDGVSPDDVAGIARWVAGELEFRGGGRT